MMHLELVYLFTFYIN